MEPQISEKLIAVVQSLSQARTLDQIMKIVRSAARELVESDGATFILKDGPYCFYADEDAVGPLWKGQRFPLNSCVSGWAMQHKQQVVIRDIYHDPRVPIDAYRPTFVKSLVMVPVRTNDPVAAIGNYWAKEYTPTEEQLRVIQALADTTSVALENVQLYSDLQKRIQELAASNHFKDNILNVVSHELKTPLTAICGWSDLLAMGTLSSNEASNGIKTIRSSAYTQLQIVNNLLDTSQIFLGRLPLEKKKVDFVDLVKKAIQLEQPKADERDQIIQFQSKAPTVCIHADRDRLTQAIRNMIGNAIKFSPNRKTIYIQIQLLGPQVELSIRDEGVGIPPSILPLIFDAFRQEDSTSTRKHGGLGLGLAISKHLIEAHDGKVKAESTGKGKGSCFTVFLPLAEDRL